MMAVPKNGVEPLNVLISAPWKVCSYCPNKMFKTSMEFTRHLRDNHCSQEGGSFVCHYGYNGVCSSLPVEGVSDKDYEDHVLKHHTKSQDVKDLGLMSGLPTLLRQGHLQRLNLISDGMASNVNAACQNMAAILNDPKKGKQKDFFTRTWGEGFVEHTEIPSSPLLPEVTEAYFAPYLKKISKRCKKPVKVQTSTTSNELSQQFPNLQAAKTMERSQADLDSIPKTFLQFNFNLSQRETFFKVFPFIEESGLPQVLKSGKLLQEKLSHYLDLIEMQIAHQISHKSDAFFQAVASHDSVREELGKALINVQGLRSKVNHIDAMLVHDSLKVIKCRVARQNYAEVYRKLKLMATVHQTQPTIQLLLSTSDFVGALDLISTSQEVVHQELMNIHCFRHLSSQLSEMENIIGRMLSTEFERLATSELNRPLCHEVLVVEEDRLSSVLYGMLRQRNYNFIQLFKDEALTAMKALMKQEMVKALAENDTDVDRGLLFDQLKHLTFAAWTNLMRHCMVHLKSLLHRVRAIYDVMTNVVSMAVSRGDEAMVPELDGRRVQQSLTEMLQSICNSAHEQCARLLSPRTNDMSLLERVSSQEFVDLAQLIQNFVVDCEKISGHQARDLRIAFQGQATRFVQRFHEERRSKLNNDLKSERWRQSNVTKESQAQIDRFLTLACCQTLLADRTPPQAFDVDVKDAIFVNEEAFIVAAVAISFLPQMFDYCNCVDNLPTAAPDLLTRLVDLLKTFNSRTCQLVLGAEALQLVGMKTITSRNLALASRSLQFVAYFIPFLKTHFEEKLPAKQKSMIKHFDKAAKDYADHIVEIENKLLSLMGEIVDSNLATWEIKPPVPSAAFRAICQQAVKLHKAIATVWPLQQVQLFYIKFNNLFKEKLRKQIQQIGVQNDGGPQHGLVTSEVSFYVENLKSSKIVGDEETVQNFTRELWNLR